MLGALGVLSWRQQLPVLCWCQQLLRLPLWVWDLPAPVWPRGEPALQAVFTFDHPNRAEVIDNTRSIRLAFECTPPGGTGEGSHV